MFTDCCLGSDEMTGQAVYSFVILKPEFSYDKEDALIKELTLQVRKNIGPCQSICQHSFYADINHSQLLHLSVLFCYLICRKLAQARLCAVCCARSRPERAISWATCLRWPVGFSQAEA